MTRNKQKTLNERYRDALEALTPAQAVLSEIAAVGRVTIATARAWVTGKQKPDDAKLQLLSAHFGIPENELFPPKFFDK